MRTRGKRIWMFFAFIGVFALGGVIVMLLWNWLMPVIFGLTAISFLQALGLMLLSRLLLCGFGHKGGFHGKHKHLHEHRRDIHEKMRGMSRDERREFIRGHMFGGPCGDSRPREGAAATEDNVQ